MEKVEQFFEQSVNLFWNSQLILFIFITGLLLTIYLQIPQLRFLPHAIKVIFGKYVRLRGLDEYSNFKALTIAISTPIGLGSVAGVTIALSIGGPGTLFWMWVAGILGMAHKLSCTALSLQFRQIDPETHQTVNGPMYAIKQGLGKLFHPMAFIFAGATILVALSAGSMFQSNQMGKMLEVSLHLSPTISGVIFAGLTALSLIFGIKDIAEFVARFAPTIVLIYFLGAMGIIIPNWEQVPDLFSTILSSAFDCQAIAGGVFGTACKEALVHGARRAMFSNEAGLGSAGLSLRPAKINPTQEGIVAMLGPIIDTIIVSTMTILVVMLTNSWTPGSGLQGIELTAQAFSASYGQGGKHLITLFVLLFAFSTILTWSYFGEVTSDYIFGKKGAHLFKYFFILAVFAGTILPLRLILNISDTFIAIMCIPNILANILMAKKVRKELRKFKNDLRAERI